MNTETISRAGLTYVKARTLKPEYKRLRSNLCGQQVESWAVLVTLLRCASTAAQASKQKSPGDGGRRAGLEGSLSRDSQARSSYQGINFHSAQKEGDEIGRLIAHAVEDGITERRPWYDPSEKLPDRPIIDAQMNMEFETLVVDIPSAPNPAVRGSKDGATIGMHSPAA